MNLRIYTLTHKKFEIPSDPMYVPLQVGAALHEDLGYLRDDEGENISAQNIYYSELTGLYWIWKNVHDVDHVGTCHYRRYLINDREKVLTRGEYEDLLKDHDIVVTKLEHLNHSYYDAFCANHNRLAMDAVAEAIQKLYPEDYPTFDALVHQGDTYYCNMMVTSKALYDQYCDWLFSIFFEAQEHVNLDTEEDAYHKRVFGFISEFLLTVWIRCRGLKAAELKVGLLGEKAEIREVKKRLAEYFAAEDLQGAKAYFLEQRRLRPDLLMEASDITGELRLCMQVIATAEAEQSAGEFCILAQGLEFPELMGLFARTNMLADRVASEEENQQTEILAEKLTESYPDIPISSAMIRIGILLAEKRKMSADDKKN